MRKLSSNAYSTLDPSRLFCQLSPVAQISNLVLLFIFNLLSLAATSGLTFYLFQENSKAFAIVDANHNSPASANPENPTISIRPDDYIPEFIDLQLTVDNWLTTLHGTDVGLMIYDLDNNRVAANHQADKIFSVASIYKLFYVYDGYTQIYQNQIDPDSQFVTTQDYRADTYTFSECLDLMVRESYNGCADAMYNNSAISSRVDDLITNLELPKTSDYGLRSSAQDLTSLLLHFIKHTDFSTELYDQFLDSMLNQPPTQVSPGIVNNWRQGLPSGFSSDVLVYDKVGWEWNGRKWNIFADAAIVNFPEQERHYIMVVLTSGLPSADTHELTRLGQMLEAAIKN